MTTGSLLLLSTVFLGMGVFEYDGLYSQIAVAWMALGFTSLLLAALGYLKKIRMVVAAPTELALLLSLLLFTYIAMFKMPGTYFTKTTNYAHEFFLLQTLLVAALCTAFFFVPRSNNVLKIAALLLCGAVAFILRVWMLSASPTPQIDVFSAAQHAMEAWFSGIKNPYVVDGSGIVAFHYPPGNLYVQAISFGLIGDVRGIYIASEIAFAAFLWWGSRPSLGDVRALLLSNMFLFHPRGLYILELAWTEPPILAFLALAMLLMTREKKNAAAIAYGLALSLKQYLVFFLVHWFLLERNWKRFALMLGAAALTVIPFLFIDPVHMFENGFLHTLQGGDVRSDSLTIVTFLQQTAGITLPRMTGAFVGLLASASTFYAFRKSPNIPAFLFSSAITTFALFLFGGQAFANYYYVVGGLTLMLTAYHMPENGV